MEARKITKDSFVANIKNSTDAVPVRGVQYNQLYNDLHAHIPDDGVGKFNTIREYTSGSGTAVGGVLLKDNGISLLTGGISITPNVTQFTKEIILTETEIVGSGTGSLNHTDGAILIPAPNSGYILQYVDALLIYEFDTIDYANGGHDLFIRIGSSGTHLDVIKNVAKSLLLGTGENRIYAPYKEYSGQIGLPVPTGPVTINIHVGTAFTQPGSAAGVLRCYITYNVIKTGL